ncbi:sensor histidine kinase [Candidatus Magnetaquicoccus inordinatus]|uniref:sensor histidine kinase n=1 Tax=Candidatus Magnetaquicoccus inordinatus TaxID=2496818 RepID=UPI00102D16BE|nr:HAMP domain-containing sensor histidine kinase [Candidatus Magnetaquicoccus inordinatus]
MRPWQQLWRSASLTSKTALIMIVVGTLFLSAVDYWQTIQIRSTFRSRLLNELEVQAQRDRLLFDQHFRAQEQAVQLFAQRSILHHYVSEKQQEWQQESAPRQWQEHHPPPWLPTRSLMRNLIAAPYILLLDQRQQIREIYREQETLPALAPSLLQRISALPSDNEPNHIISAAEGAVYLVSAGEIFDHQQNVIATIVWIAPLDNDFLSIFHTTTESDSIVVLLHGITGEVFASSRPERVASGQTRQQLEKENILFGKLLDYGSAVQVPIHFISMVPLADIDTISFAVRQSIRDQFVLGYGILALLLLTIIILIIHKVQHSTEKMVAVTAQQLGLQPQQEHSGDHLELIEQQLQWMTQEILRSRQQEQARQEELQQINESLHASLQAIRQAQEHLVASEKMASLGILVAGVAHEINTPVGTGITAASFLESKCQEYALRIENDPPSQAEWQQLFLDLRESSQMVLSNLMRAAELVRSFKQIAVDRTQEERRLFGLQDYLHHVLRSLHPLLARSRHSITVHCPEEIVLDSYPGSFSQILTQLVVNSLMHAFRDGEAGKISIDVLRREHSLHIFYADDGCGMSQEERQRIFDPFFTTARHRGAHGLGLHVLFNLVTQNLQGSIHCDTAPGQGTRYEIIIPQRDTYQSSSPSPRADEET